MMPGNEQPDHPPVNYLPGEAFLSVSDYDSGICNLVPQYENMLGILSALFPPETGRILELGSGTGELTLRLLQKCPGSHVMGIDYSERMLQEMEKKIALAGFSDRVRMVKASMTSLGQPGEPVEIETPFDGCASALALHHLTFSEKARLLNWLFPKIREGGLVWWADVVDPEDEALKPVYLSAGEQWLREMKYAPEKMAGKKISDQFPSMAAHHFPESVTRWRHLFQQAGFRRFDLLWKFFGLAIFGAVK